MLRIAAIVAFGPALLLGACADHPQTASTAPAPVQTAAPATPPAAASPERLLVEFPYGSAELSPKGQDGLDQGARLYRDGHPTIMFVAGHADPTGDEFANLMLSGRRADAVKKGLVARGIPADKLELQAFGASQPLVAPDPQAPENRSAVVTWR